VPAFTYVLARRTVVLVLASLVLFLLTASAAGANDRAVVVAKSPVKVNNTLRGIKFYAYYDPRGVVRHYRVTVVACLQVRSEGRWAYIAGACARDTDRRDVWVDVGRRVPCFLGRHRFRTVAAGWVRTRSGERRQFRRDVSPPQTIRCRA
jgi:hypothetical protein